MTVFWLMIGLLPPAVIGWCLVRVLEWKSPVLHAAERWIVAAVLGPTAMSIVHFGLQTLAGVPFSRTGFLLGQALTFLLLGIPLLHLRTQKDVPLPSAPSTSHGSPPRWITLLLCLLLIWSGIRLLGMGSQTLLIPTYFDDAVENWNLRGKIFFHTQRLELTIPPDTAPGGVSSYPPSLPLIKTWLAAVQGTWDEGVINGVHLLWLLGCLGLVYCAIRRHAGRNFALLGVYLLSSLPLFLMHGTNAYADVFLASHIFAAAWMLLEAAKASTRSATLSHIRIFCLPLALIPFTKNEGLLLYLPSLLAIATVVLWLQRKNNVLSRHDIAYSLAWIAGAVLLCLPWIGFKMMNGLTFGNAKSISGFSLEWQPGVVTAVIVNTFFEGNWLLLFPLFLLLLIVRWQTAFRTRMIVLTLAFLLPYCTQLLLYLFTSLSTEALLQTGYARGLIHLVPLVVTLTVLLLQQLCTAKRSM